MSKLVKLSVKLGKCDVISVVDTGAGVSVVSKSCVDRCFKNAMLPWDGPSIVLANGTRMRPSFGVELNFMLENSPVKVFAAILDLKSIDLLLGCDALAQVGKISIDYNQDPPVVKFCVDVDEPKVEHCKVVSDVGVSVPAYSVLNFDVSFRDKRDIDKNSGNYFFEPNQKLFVDKGLCVGKALITAETNVLPIVNFTREAQWLEKGTVVGSVEVVDEIDEKPITDGKSAPLKEVSELDFDSRISKKLTRKQRKQVRKLLKRFASCFATSNGDLGQVDVVAHTIDTGDAQPIFQPPYASSFKQREVIKDQVEEMLKNDVIEPASGPWASPVVLVKKPDGSWRFCVDYRRLNDVTTGDVYPLPRIEDALSLLQGSTYFSSLDMQSGFWQIKVDPKDRAKTAFVTPDGLFQFKVLPFGLINSPRTFQRTMDVLLAGLKWYICLVYIDDIIVFARTFQEHLERLEIVLRRIADAKIKLKLAKCHFFESTLLILGHLVDELGVRPNPAKIRAVSQFPEPKNLKEVQRFVGMCSYYRRFISHFSEIARPLSNLSKKGVTFRWGTEQQNSFEQLKEALTTEPLLRHPNYSLPMEIHCDASGEGLGAVLVQRIDEKEHPIAYASRLLKACEKNYTVTELECLALVFAVKRFKAFIWGMQVRIVTDHHALCWLLKKRDLTGRLARWSLALQDLELEIVHKSGKHHQDADALSRSPVDEPDAETDITSYYVGFSPHLGGISDVGVQRQQSEDSFCAKIIRAFESESQQKRDFKIKRQFIIRKNLLYRRTIRNGREHFQLCVPKTLTRSILLACHDDITAGHLGVTRTLDKITRRYYWPKMITKIVAYVRSCVDCQMRKQSSALKGGLLKPIKVSRPFEIVGMDVLGPFPQSELGNRYILVAIDYLTKWVIAKAISRTTSDLVAQFFVENIVLQHGAPEKLLTDRGRYFNSKFSRQLYRCLRTNYVSTTAYHPQCNGLVERFNKTLAQMLSMYVSTSQKDWDQVLPFVIFGYNTSRQDSTRCTPFYMLYGREPHLPIDTALGNEFDDNDETLEITPVHRRASQMQSIRERVRRQLEVVHARQRHRYNQRRIPKVFDVGDLILIYTPLRRKGRSEKLLFQYHGPYRVVKRYNRLNYLVSNCNKRSHLCDRVHVDRMKQFYIRSDDDKGVADGTDGSFTGTLSKPTRWKGMTDPIGSKQQDLGQPEPLKDDWQRSVSVRAGATTEEVPDKPQVEVDDRESKCRDVRPRDPVCQRKRFNCADRSAPSKLKARNRWNLVVTPRRCPYDLRNKSQNLCYRE